MSPEGKSKNLLAQGRRLTEEFSTMQLVIGVSMLMLFGLVCFLAGILVGQLDSSLGTTEPQEVEQAAAATVESEPSPDSEPKDASVPDKPKQEEKPKPTPKAMPRPAGTGITSGPRVTDLPPLPAPGGAPSESAKSSQPAPANTTAARPPAPKLEPIAPPPAATETKPADPVPPKENSPAPQPAPTPTPAPPANPKPTAQGKFAIQLASFSGDTRNEEAATYQRRLKENANLDAQIQAGDDGYTRVLIPGFETREAADKALADVQRKPGLSDAYVRALP